MFTMLCQTSSYSPKESPRKGKGSTQRDFLLRHVASATPLWLFVGFLAALSVGSTSRRKEERRKVRGVWGTLGVVGRPPQFSFCVSPRAPDERTGGPTATIVVCASIKPSPICPPPLSYGLKWDTKGQQVACGRKTDKESLGILFLWGARHVWRLETGERHVVSRQGGGGCQARVRGRRERHFPRTRPTQPLGVVQVPGLSLQCAPAPLVLMCRGQQMRDVINGGHLISSDHPTPPLPVQGADTKRTEP